MTEDNKSSSLTKKSLHEDQRLLVRILIALVLIGSTVLVQPHFDSDLFRNSFWWIGLIVAYLVLQAIVIKILKARSCVSWEVAPAHT